MGTVASDPASLEATTPRRVPAWIVVHGVVQAALIVLAALGGCAAMPAAGPSHPQASTPTADELNAVRTRLNDLEARLTRDEYALVAVDRHAVDARQDVATLRGATAAMPPSSASASASTSTVDPATVVRARGIVEARERVAASERASRSAVARGDAPIPAPSPAEIPWTRGDWR